MDDHLSPPENILFDVFRSHKRFGLQIQQELARAERYCEFISLVVIGISRDAEAASESDEGVPDADDLYDGLRKLIGKSIRITDYVSGVEGERMGLLLVETPRNGAETLVRRLRPTISDFVSPHSPDLDFSYSILSYPSDTNSKNTLVTAIGEFLQE